MKPVISVVIPAYNACSIVGNLLESLRKQTFTDFETIVVDDGSIDKTEDVVRGFKNVKFVKKEHSGPAAARNLGIKNAKGEIIAFTDADCIADSDWLKSISEAFIDGKVNAVMGRVKILKSNFLGDSISALGFPAGGAVGFEKMWKVSNDGFTDHLSTCNCAVRKNLFEKYGFFDEIFKTAGNEDSEFSHRLAKNNVKIKYCPDAVIFHKTRADFISFLRWNLKRGGGNYYFKQRVGDVTDYVKLRFWSTKNILREYYKDKKIWLIIILLFLSFVFQQIGYLKEKFKRK